MSSKRFSFFFISLFFFGAIHSQDSLTFKPSGKVIARSYLDYSTSFGDESESGFDITRAFLGYNYKIKNNLQVQVVIDGASGHTENGSLTVYLRNAFVTWEEGKWAINGGLINSLQFKEQEFYWGQRYVMRSFQDEYKFGASVDAGVNISYQFAPQLAADFSILNGEGYKMLEKSKSNRYALGITAKPVNGLLFRVYGDVYNESVKFRDPIPNGIVDVKYTHQYIAALFGGYRNDKFSVGAEYNKIFNKGFIEGKDTYGFSFFGTLNFTPKWSAYARYDSLDSSSTYQSGWNRQDGNYTIVGIGFKPINQLKISPNFRHVKLSNLPSTEFIYLNVEFNL